MLLNTFSGEEIDVIGAGRTDAGVHAIGQVANFHIREEFVKDFDDAKLLLYINEKLPRDIAITKLERVDEKFHARFNAIEKTYRYRIHVSPISNVFEKRFVYTYLDYPIDVATMKEAAKLMLGRKDFKAFCGNKHMKKSTVRTVSSIDIKEVEDENGLREICIDYTGDGFLQNMIRIMSGTLIEVATGRKTVDSISEIIRLQDRENAGYTAPAQGLTLLSVRYQ